MSHYYDSLDHILRSETQESREIHNIYNNILKKTYRKSAVREYLQLILIGIVIVINSIILYIICFELKKFYNIFSSFSSDINTDVKNFNEFLQVIPQLKDVLAIILNLCNTESIHPFCNNSTKKYIEL